MWILPEALLIFSSGATFLRLLEAKSELVSEFEKLPPDLSDLEENHFATVLGNREFELRFMLFLG